MRSYEPRPSPQRLRQASLLVIALAGASTGLLAGLGWRLFQEGFREIAVRVWVVSSALVIVYLLVAVLARVIAALIETDRPADLPQALRNLQDRVDELERELGWGCASLTDTSPRVSSFEPPVETSAM